MQAQKTVSQSRKLENHVSSPGDVIISAKNSGAKVVMLASISWLHEGEGEGRGRGRGDNP